MKAKKKFDSVKMMREIRAQVNAEISVMNTKQILDYLKASHKEAIHLKQLGSS